MKEIEISFMETKLIDFIDEVGLVPVMKRTVEAANFTIITKKLESVVPTTLENQLIKIVRGEHSLNKKLLKDGSGVLL